MSLPFRIGFGFDVHCFAAGRPLILGGIEVPFHSGLAGHSDADVLSHALGDALLGAACLGDLGHYFPDSDRRYKGISSLKLLETIKELIDSAGYKIGNVDTTVVAQEPKLAPFIVDMQKTLSSVLEISTNQISIKATTTEGLGYAGRREGVAAYAVALLVLKSNSQTPVG